VIDAGMTWTEERVELLIRLWDEGLSASRIASELGGSITRNAVIGKVHRLGLAGRAKANAPMAHRNRKPVQPPATPATGSFPPGGADPGVPATEPQPGNGPEPLSPAADHVRLALSERVTIMELRESMCRWPLGDPTTADFRYCGARAITGLPYCSHHAQIAYQPAAERKRLRA
jgi:GcrA cell cycle regulator